MEDGLMEMLELLEAARRQTETETTRQQQQQQINPRRRPRPAALIDVSNQPLAQRRRLEWEDRALAVLTAAETAIELLEAEEEARLAAANDVTARIWEEAARQALLELDEDV